MVLLSDAVGERKPHLFKENDKYYGAAEVQSPGIYLYMNRDVQTAAQKEAGQEAPSYFDLLMDGKSDGCLADYEQYKRQKPRV